MRIDDETVRAHAACRDLRDLYTAYQAGNHARVFLLERMVEVEDGATHVHPEQRLRVRLELTRDMALAADADTVLAIRGEQLRRRIRELRDLPEPR